MWIARSTGLSPRVRGNLSRLRGKLGAVRSIPASAGEPPRQERRRRGNKVYPRECGGTVKTRPSNMLSKGLSPRVRGNRQPTAKAGPHLRSIPASAGEPDSHAPLRGPGPVYPRECGGTERVNHFADCVIGLSPRVRGNHEVTGVGIPRIGSIPASAGEPTLATIATYVARVYPRECGGTHCPTLYSPT